MNNEPLNISIMGRDFCITCPDDEREEILLAAAYLDNKIQEIRAEGKIVDSDRIALIAALRIAHELLVLRDGTDFDINEFRRRIASLSRKVDEALAHEDN
ncbi:cell division protein ZapA [Nitrosomonas sp.]|uniref:cell division protein ZapA n=1 Tax=Nitrosomonas sp. TaxID=42353 RepID=UPI0025F0D9D5|nr:cell division protein ZapA [Nitrosomonas sp.]MBS0588605.1 cell division protein ZapA [Pseudomonadota bacterium]MBV6448328.1 Cell division protein ZapA [Nitrosomonas sp.]